MRPIVVLGAGSWGTALAIQFARSGRPTVLWGRAEDNPAELATSATVPALVVERTKTRLMPHSTGRLVDKI